MKRFGGESRVCRSGELRRTEITGLRGARRMLSLGSILISHLRAGLRDRSRADGRSWRLCAKNAHYAHGGVEGLMEQLGEAVSWTAPDCRAYSKISARGSRRRYFFAPFMSCPPWCSTRDVTSPLSFLRNSSCASTTFRKNLFSDSAKIGNFG